MKRQFVVGLSILLLAASFSAAKDVEYKPGELLVRFDESALLPSQANAPEHVAQRKAARMAALKSAGGGKIEKTFKRAHNLGLVKLPKGVSVEQALIIYNNTPGILRAEPNYKFKLDRTPDDEFFSDQWSLHNTGQTGGTVDADIDAPEAWDIHTGDSNSNVVVAVIDTGIDYNHYELKVNMWVNPDEDGGSPGFDDDGNGYIDDIHGYDFAGADVNTPDHDADPADTHGHGTFVASIIGAVGNDNFGMTGVCWDVKLMALKGFADNVGYALTDELVEAVHYATDMATRHNLKMVINASWGGGGYSTDLKEAIEEADDAGILFVASAGNYNQDNDAWPRYPSSYDVNNIISVMSTDHDDNKSDFSHYGVANVDIGAPGTDILGTLPMVLTPDGWIVPYAIGSGTSFAAPHVAGACALMNSLVLSTPGTHVRSHELIKTILLQTVDPTLPGLCVSGGRLNLHEALKMVWPGRVVNAITNSKYNTIQSAINAAKDNTTLIADKGHWFFENVDFKDKNIRLRSGDILDRSDPTIYPDTTYISGLYNNGRIVTINNGQTSASDVNGFTIRDGRGGIYCDGTSPGILNCIITENDAGIDAGMDGGGIYCDNGASPKINNCTISNNTTTYWGGGIYCSYGSNPDINDCTISGNTSTYDGAGIYCLYSDPTIQNCRITNNVAMPAGSGGGIYCEESSPVINECTITGNQALFDGGGIDCTYGSNPDITNCTIGNNKAIYYGGGINASDSLPLIKNCLIVDNTTESYYGGAIYLDNASVEISNCTVSNNTVINTLGTAGGVYCSDSSPTITDCIFTDNENYAIYESDPTSDPTVTYSLFYNNSDGDYYDNDTSRVYNVNSADTLGLDPNNLNNLAEASDNLDADPIFVPGRLGNYYLSQEAAGQIMDPNGDVGKNPGDADSPALDTGSDTAANLVMDIYSTRTDIVNDAGVVDIGFHYNDPCAPIMYILTTVANPNEWGMILRDPNDPNSSYVQYSQVSLTAVPKADDYMVGLWSGADKETNEPNDPNNFVTMSSDRTVTVTFLRALVRLRTRIDIINGDGTGTIEPRGETRWRRGAVVNLEVDPDNAAHRIIWNGSDNDSSNGRTNMVTMDADVIQEVVVLFIASRTIDFPGDSTYPTLQAAIDDAQDGDKIIIEALGSETPYVTSWGFDINGKAIIITGEDPADPCVVAATVFEKNAGPDGSSGPAFTFFNVGNDTVLKGITIRRFGGTGWMADDGDQDHPDGWDGGSVYGGAILCWYNASPTIEYCVIEDCNITGGDGGNGTGGRTGIDDAHPDGFDGGWPGGAFGGGMAILNGSNPIVKNTTFKDCSVNGGNGGDGGSGTEGAVGGRGGGWYYGASSWWYNFPWRNPLSGWYGIPSEYSGRGGAVYVDEYCSPVFENCTFINNRSGGGTNGICGQNDGSGTIAEPSIRWRIDNLGGGVYCADNSTVKFENCEFNYNMADVDNIDPEPTDAVVSYGGAVTFEDNANVTFDNCSFNGNEASVGGAIYGSFGDSIFDKCEFNGNLSLDGAGLYLSGGSNKVARSSFYNNRAVGEASSGGGILCFDADTTIFDSDISYNYASLSGGGIHIYGSDQVTLKNCLISNNSDGKSGGGVSLSEQAKANSTNCSIVDNRVTANNSNYGGGGLFCNYQSDADIINSIFWGNTAGYGAQISIGAGDNHSNPSRVSVSYSDVQAGAVGVHKVINDCELIWSDVNNLTGTSLSDPNFISTSWADYCLSQTDVDDPNQTVDSPCVDVGSDNVKALNMYRHSTRTDRELDDGMVDMGYHYVLNADIVGDLNFDGLVDILDYVLFLEQYLEQGCDFPYWCHEADINQDGIVNLIDDALFLNNYGQTEKVPPEPDPMSWAVAPISTGAGQASITMTATTAIDNSGYPVLYYFECFSGSGNDRIWDPCSTYTDTGLTVDNEYSYRVKATDYRHEIDDTDIVFDASDSEDPNIGNKTDWSVVGYAIAGEDVNTPPPTGDDTPPTPSPLTWATPPYAAAPNSIEMLATTAADTSGVEYYFMEVSGFEHESGWQDSPFWEDANLTPDTEYYYQVMARDKSTNQNATGWSSAASATTPAEGEEPPVEDNEAPTPNPSLWLVPPTRNSGIIYMEAFVATDTSQPVMYYFECVLGSGLDSGWQLSNIFTYPHNSDAVYVVRTMDAAGNVGLDSQPWNTAW